MNTPIRTGPAPFAVAGSAAGAVIAAFALLRIRDPHVATYVACPFHTATGMWCPLCGGLRAGADLTHGDVVGSLSSNALVAPAVVVAVFAWLAWVAGRPPRPGRAAVWTLVAVALAFTLARNTDWGAWFAP
ncbi:MAG TPA: DUF2752 domain-containing protein [Aldersonia sp.]